MRNKKPKKIRRRKSATKPPAVSSKDAANPTTYPPAQPERSIESRLMERAEEVYNTQKGKILWYLRSKGIRDPEDAFHDAILSVLRSCSGDELSLQYLPNRLRCRKLNARDAHLRRQRREVLEDDDYWNGLSVDGSPKIFNRHTDVLEWLFERLDSKSRLLLTQFHLEGYTVEVISALSGSPVGTIKSALSRARHKARNLLLELQAKESEGCNQWHDSEG